MATDVCRILGMHVRSNGKPNVAIACRHLNEDQKGVYQIHTPYGAPKAVVISESGLYKLIMRSDKDTARPFQDWVKGGRRGVDPPSSLTAHAVLVRFSDGAP